MHDHAGHVAVDAPEALGAVDLHDGGLDLLDGGIDHVFIADHVSFINGLGMDGLINAATLTKQRIVSVLDIVSQLARRAVEPDVGDHSVNCRVGARGKGRVADHGFGVGMTMMRVNIERTFIEKSLETALAVSR